MSAPRLEQASEILLRLVDAPPERRDALLDQLCAGDLELRTEVHSLLQHHDESFLAQPAARPPAEAPDGDEGRAQLERIGDYKLLRVLGRGGMGVVYEAVQEDLGRRVALKLVRADLLDTELGTSFEREARVLAQLRHPGIAQIHAAGVAHTTLGPQPYLAMELVDGPPIDRHVARAHLDADAVCALGVQVCEAVAHAHDHGVVHRDLKPDNVLVDTGGRPRILDFGVARMTDADQKLSTLGLGTGVLVGTLPYMSPEQAAGQGAAVGIRSDVYALGVLLYELLSGELPLDLDDLPLNRMVEAIRHDAPIPLRHRLPHADPDLETILLKTLEKEPERRYWSAHDLAEDLGRYLRREPIRARPPTLWHRTRRFSQRHRALVFGSMAVFVTLLAGVIFASLGFWNAHQKSLEVLQLSSHARLQDLLDEAEECWPARPEDAARYRAWIEQASGLLEELPQHRTRLAQLRAEARKVVDERRGESTWVLDDARSQWWHDSLAALVADLEPLQNEDPFVSALASMRAREEFASGLARRSLEEPAQRWREAVASIANPELCPLYRGLEIRPQLGLVPLRRDPHSGLWEFAHLASGEPPPLGPDGRYCLDDPAAGLVLVLIPGGRYTTGSQDQDPTEPFYEPGRELHELPLTTVELDPFFLAKTELSRRQWLRTMGRRVNYYVLRPETIAPGQPVENLSWLEAEEVLRRLGLDFPTEFQWEVAARAGQPGPWWTGPNARSLEGAANLADASVPEALRSSNWKIVDWLRDGFSLHGPVGSLAPNPFGLHDVHGNVAEWCKDQRPFPSEPARPGDGLRVSGRDRRVARGGSFTGDEAMARAAQRRIEPASSKSDDVGVRPCRPLER